MGLQGYTPKVTKKKMKQLVEENRPHFITGYAPIIFNISNGTYNCYSNEEFHGKNYEQVWSLLKKYNMNTAKLCYQE